MPKNLWAVEAKYSIKVADCRYDMPSINKNESYYFWAKNILWNSFLDIQDYESAISILENIADEQRANELIEQYKRQIEKIKTEESQARIKKEEVEKLERKKKTKSILIKIICVAFLFLVWWGNNSIEEKKIEKSFVGLTFANYFDQYEFTTKDTVEGYVSTPSVYYEYTFLPDGKVLKVKNIQSDSRFINGTLYTKWKEEKVEMNYKVNKSLRGEIILVVDDEYSVVFDVDKKPVSFTGEK